MIRLEKGTDHGAVRAVHGLAFGQAAEGKLVDELRRGGYARLSLVAEEEGAIVGHLLFSELHIDAVKGLALAPLAVVPAHQRRGIGSALMREGLKRLKQMNHSIVIVLGHPEYYPRFGFRADLTRGLESPYAGKESFMALELAPGAMAGVRGKVVYARPFDAL